jgi:hypothetical protein
MFFEVSHFLLHPMHLSVPSNIQRKFHMKQNLHKVNLNSTILKLHMITSKMWNLRSQSEIWIETHGMQHEMLDHHLVAKSLEKTNNMQQKT